MAPPPDLSQQAQGVPEDTTRPSTTLKELRQARARYYERSLPLHALSQLAADGDAEVAEALARVYRGQLCSIDLTGRLEGAYAELQQDLDDLVFPDQDDHPPLVDYVDSLTADVDSLNSTLISQRAALLDLLTSPALARPKLPETPDLSATAVEMRHSTATLATGQAKLALLLGQATASHSLHRVGETAELTSELLEPQLQAFRTEVEGLEKQREKFEKLMSAEDDGSGKGGYRKLLKRWKEFDSEEKDVRGDLRRLGWIEG